MTIRITCVAITAAALAGCAGPSWQHTQIMDPATSARQLVIDDGYCTAVSQNSAPVPQVILADGPKTSNFNLQGTTRNTQTGATSYSDYSGQMTTAPTGAAAGFASGMANGMNIGNAIMASQAQERIHKSCMFAKGWTDTKGPGAATVAAVALQPAARTSAPVSGTIARIGIYATPTASWEADCTEFFLLFPSYGKSEVHARLDAQVRKIAVASPTLTGPQILLAARTALLAAGMGAAEEASASVDLIRAQYRGAADGTLADQANLAFSYAQGSTGFPSNETRAAFWAQESAIGGSYPGQVGFGHLRFSGSGVPVSRVDGYLWVKRAAEQHGEAQSTLRKFERQMTTEELRAVR